MGSVFSMVVDVNRGAAQRVAIIGAGIAGMTAAYLLNDHHDICVYEENDYLGGHARTRSVICQGEAIAVDTGFIVFNHKNYPNFTKVLKHLGVPTKKSVMSFGVTSERENLEWGAENLGALFGQRRNLVRPAFYLFLFDIVRFNFRAKRALERYPAATLGELIEKMRFGEWFKQYYILPMGGAIWSCPLSALLTFPAKFFIDFFDAHGLLTVSDQPQWYTVSGGSAVYVDKLTDGFKDKVRKSCGVSKVTRRNQKVQITDRQGQTAQYDQVVFACHADQILAILEDPTADELTTFGAFRYQTNIAVLHKCEGIMPRHKRCWSSWVYHDTASAGRLSVTYWMNHLQGIGNDTPLFVSLNPHKDIPKSDVFETHTFTHPIYDPATVSAQSKLSAIQGEKNSWFCGAYCRNGFHEDGVVSAMDVAARMGVPPPWP